MPEGMHVGPWTIGGPDGTRMRSKINAVFDAWNPLSTGGPGPCSSAVMPPEYDQLRDAVPSSSKSLRGVSYRADRHTYCSILCRTLLIRLAVQADQRNVLGRCALITPLTAAARTDLSAHAKAALGRASWSMRDVDDYSKLGRPSAVATARRRGTRPLYRDSGLGRSFAAQLQLRCLMEARQEILQQFVDEQSRRPPNRHPPAG